MCDFVEPSEYALMPNMYTIESAARHHRSFEFYETFQTLVYLHGVLIFNFSSNWVMLKASDTLNSPIRVRRSAAR